LGVVSSKNELDPSTLGKMGLPPKLVGVRKPGMLLREGRLIARLCCLIMGDGVKEASLCSLMVRVNASIQLFSSFDEGARTTTRSEPLLNVDESGVLGEGRPLDVTSEESRLWREEEKLEMVDTDRTR